MSIGKDRSETTQGFHCKNDDKFSSIYCQNYPRRFDKHYLAFRTNSQLAKSKFENSEYSGIRELLSERISFYDFRVKERQLF